MPNMLPSTLNTTAGRAARVEAPSLRLSAWLNPLKFNSDTGLCFRQDIVRPFLDQYLKEGAPKADIVAVTAFETGRILAPLARLASRLRE
jgi:hypothetical protein